MHLNGSYSTCTEEGALKRLPQEIFQILVWPALQFL